MPYSNPDNPSGGASSLRARLTARFIPGQNAAMVHLVHSAPIAIIRRLPLCMWLRVRVSGPEVC
ncbi:MAG: hypothetical protein ABL877_04425 [Thiobacillus sp.]